ncbi:hypothetical protein ACQEWB_25555 [Streptomyces sp. CA-249302]|uniref:hypothetical protein n=1 Tax=Streptomyces sp. CA-249302 TaxID=3240058 RepID=UPI003D89CD5E
MILFLLIVGVLCLSGYSIVYSLSPPGRATVPGTPAQDEAAFLTAERDRFDELVAGLGLPQLSDTDDELTGVYRERAHLLGWLAALHPYDAFRTAATDVDEPGWQLLCLDIGGHRLRWRIAPRDAELFEHVTTVPFTDPHVQWDGSSTDEKYQHIRSLTLTRRSADVRPTTSRSNNIDALLDGYAHRGTVIQQALRLVDTVLDTPSTGATEQHPVHEFAHRIRRALLVSSPRTGN